MVERKRFQRRNFLKAGGVAGLGLLAGCAGGGGSDGETNTDASGGDDGGSDSTDGGSDSGGNSGEPIVIGSMQPLSGPFTPWGNAHRAGLAFAVEEINSDGGVLGRDLEIVESDTKSDAGQADTVFRRFVEQENAVATVGPVSSDVGIRTARTAQELEVPMLLHMSGTNKAITPDTTYTFRVGLLPADTTMRAQANLVADAGYEKVGAIIGDYAWGRSIEEGINEHFGVDVDVQAAPVGASDFKSFIRKYPDDIEMMVATGHPPGSLTIANQLNELGYSPEVITGPSFPPGVIAGALGEFAFEGGFTHVHNTDVYSDEFAEVAQRFGEARGSQFDTHTAYGYVSAKMLAQAIEDAGEADPVAIGEALRGIKFDTLFANPIEYTENGELKNQVQIYSQLTAEAPSYYPDGKFGFEEQFRTDALPALPADQ
ncbi:ABC transporter substrate-binding protein [Halogeometricum limi]|uniref:Substrate-binding protein n=1 Tax=Halogeometricum limi TaxID=555875 RepID=A0A1I6IBR7_9EURY|nr:ABC transporter substrate-binding protein [Halogeometricum limi]SFR63830.1 substrate-binding protein [Halogeometricum limi]